MSTCLNRSKTAESGNCPPPPEFLLEQPDACLGLAAVQIIIRFVVGQDTQVLT